MNALLEFDLAQILPLLIGLSTALLLFVAVILVSSFRKRRVVTFQGMQEPLTDGAMPSVRRDESDSSIPTLDRAVKRWLPRREMLRNRLTRTGYNIRISNFLLASALFGIVLGIVGVQVVGLSLLLVTPLAVSLGIGVPYALISLLGNRRMDRFNRQFPEAIDIMVRGLRAGMPLGDSIQIVGNEFPAPVGLEFRTIDRAVTMGQPMDVALADAARRITTQEFQFFVVSLALQRETGGNLSETLDNLADILRRRRQMRLKIKAMSSEARASAWIIGMLPFVMFFVIMGVRSDYVTPLFTDPRGIVMVSFGILSIAMGIFVMTKMMRFEI
jgi:tight adherence protein B